MIFFGLTNFVQGQRCEERECGGRLHDHCMRNFFRIQRAEKCPVCQKDWPGNQYVGERAVHVMNRNRSRTTPQQAVRASSAMTGNDGASGEDDDDDDEEEG